MIFPIRCISCNNVIAGKWETYKKLVEKYRKESGKTDIEYLTESTTKTSEGKAMDELKITKQCCRRHFLTHVDLI